jgi:hypothetical protein
MLILNVLLAIGGPALQIGLKLIPLFYQYKLLKTEAEVREITRRFQEAIKEAEASAKKPDDIKKQYDSAKAAAKKKWEEMNK